MLQSNFGQRLECLRRNVAIMTGHRHETKVEEAQIELKVRKLVRKNQSSHRQ